jgi:hypothetical protein
VSGNPAWLSLNDSILSGNPPANGIFGPITITAANILGSIQQSFSISVYSAPAITSDAITTGVFNSLYAYTIEVSGTPTADLSISGNPSWLNLNGNVLSGMPSSVGTFGPITITATNSQGSAHQSFTIIVSSAPEITSSAILAGTAGSMYTYSITAIGTPSPTFSVEGNPAWLQLNGNNLLGIPTSSGLIGPVTVKATNSVSFAEQTFYIYVSNPEVNTTGSKLIHYWHFNNTLPTDGSGGILYGNHPIFADYSSIGGAALVFAPLIGVVSDTGHLDNLVGDTLNQRQGFGGCCGTRNNAIRTRNPSDSMQFLWYLPTNTYKNIVIKYETELSSIKSGQHEQVFSYSLDSATTFTTLGLPVYSYFADSVWEKVTLDLRGITAINNNGKFVLRIAFSAPNTGVKGNNRFDNITIEGDTMVEAAGLGHYSIQGYTIYPNPSEDRINLVAPFDGIRMVSIYNSTGMLIVSYLFSAKQTQIDISHFDHGLYIMKIVERNGGNEGILKFVKE